jgi:glycerol-3-phosphate dehydrogenase
MVAALAAGDPTLGAPLCAHHRGITAEIAYAVRHEWAQTLGDVLLRRTTLGLSACQGLDCIDAVAARMGGLLGWDADRQRDEIARYRNEIEPMRRFSTSITPAPADPDRRTAS